VDYKQMLDAKTSKELELDDGYSQEDLDNITKYALAIFDHRPPRADHIEEDIKQVWMYCWRLVTGIDVLKAMIKDVEREAEQGHVSCAVRVLLNGSALSTFNAQSTVMLFEHSITEIIEEYMSFVASVAHDEDVEDPLFVPYHAQRFLQEHTFLQSAKQLAAMMLPDGAMRVMHRDDVEDHEPDNGGTGMYL
jgi:hypothetical protein